MKPKPVHGSSLRSLRSALLTILLLAVAFAAWRLAFSAAAGPRAISAASPLPTPTAGLPSTSTPLPIETRQAIATARATRISAMMTRLSPRYTPGVPPTLQAWQRSFVLTEEAQPAATLQPYQGFPPLKQAGSGWLVRALPAHYDHGFAVTNGWDEIEQGGTVMTQVTGGAEWASEAEAGSVAGPQGLVVVDVWQIAPDRLSDSVVYQQTFDTPGASGEVTITGAQGERLILQSTDGTTFYFDVPTRQFVPSLAATVTAPPPTTGPVSPLATATPVP